MTFNKLSDLIIENKKITYSAVVLDKSSRQKILNNPEITKFIDSEQDVIAHHMTIKMGSLKETHHEKRIGNIETMRVHSVGVTYDGNDVIVVAVGVDGVSDNKISHVTVGVNRKKGAKPVMSNYITNWIPLKKSFEISGIVEEI